MDSGIFVGKDFIPFETERVMARDGKKELIKIPLSHLEFEYKKTSFYLENWKIKHVLYFNAEPLRTFDIAEIKRKIRNITGVGFNPRIHVRNLFKNENIYSFKQGGGGDKYILLLFDHEEFNKIDCLGRWCDILRCFNYFIRPKKSYRRPERSRSPRRDYRFERSRSPLRRYPMERSRSPRRDYRFERSRSPSGRYPIERSRSPSRRYPMKRSRSPPKATKREEILDQETKAEIEKDIMKKIMVERYKMETEERIRKEMFFTSQYPYPPPPKPSFLDGHYPH